MSISGPVIVIQLPNEMNQLGARTFLHEMELLLESDRPRIVLDCSEVRSIDSAGVESLLQCMEEAMKRNGDLKLASVSPSLEVMLELMRVDRLFEVFQTADEAMRSFHVGPVLVPAETQPWYSAVYSRLGELKVAS
jgi:anti-sigma B factor antagonist